MALFKYFAKIEAAQRAEAGAEALPLDAFDFASLGTRSRFKRWLTRFVLRKVLPLLAAILRTVWPNPRFGRFIFVTRHADCVQVLGDMANFPVVYQPEMRMVARRLGEPLDPDVVFDRAANLDIDNFLSLDNAAHDALRAQLMAEMEPQDVADVAQWSREYCAALIAAGAGEIDTMRDLITRSATEVAARWMGLTVHDADAFAEWSMAVSTLLFGDFTGDANIRKQARIGSALLGATIDDAIDRVHRINHLYPSPPRQPVTLIDRLVTRAGMPDDRVRALIMALVTAFVPTNALAAGNMFEELLSRPKDYARACKAAKGGDRAGLEAILMEMGRRNPALSPGIWRWSRDGGAAATIAPGTWRQRKVRGGDLLLVCVPSALRDGRKSPHDLANPHGRAWMMFSFGPHDCAGAYLAKAHIVSVFEVLLGQERLAPARGEHGSSIVRTGPYPVRFDMTYASPTARRALIVAALAVREKVARSEVEQRLAAIGNPILGDRQKRLDASGCIDFLSLSVIEAAEGSDRSVLLVEVNGDGEDRAVLGRLADEGHQWLGPLLACCTASGQPPADAAAMAQLIFDNVLDLHRWPWGTTGLHFDGLAELSVADIKRQDELALVARTCIDAQLHGIGGSATRAMELLLKVRRMLRHDHFLKLRDDLAPVMKDIPPALGLAIVRPGRKRLKIADWTQPKPIWRPVFGMLVAPGGRWILVSLLLLWTGQGFGLWAWTMPTGPATANDWGWSLAAGFFGGAIVALATFAALFGLFLLAVRWREKREKSDERIADYAHVEAIAEHEDHPGYEQNHIIAVMPFKPGLIRKLSFAFSMWWIGQAVTRWFRPGFVVSMGTIHKARWFRVRDTEQFVFLSNYDGSWESYLEDFITRAHEGQTSAWGHGAGFPPTRWLVLDGAQDGDRFKRWVRRQQRPSLCWYSRFPKLTAKQIRLNAMIEDGLARASSDTDARRWLAHFGSAQREVGELESAEAQSIVFTGMKRHELATALLMRLPEEKASARRWLRRIGRFGRTYAPDRDDDGLACIHFGDVPVSEPALVLGLTAAGLEHLGLRDGRGLDQLPAVFRMGMAGRQRILGDEPAGGWRWSDAPEAANRVDAILTVYGGGSGSGAMQRGPHGALVGVHRKHFEKLGGVVVHEIPCQPVVDEDDKPTPEREHFGFRDGVSQPVIRGSRLSGLRPPTRDIVSAGEFLLGYRNDQGYVSPSIGIGAEHDPRSILPTFAEDKTNRFPFFGSRSSSPDLRDFGRNGSFMVVRQLDQDVAGFEEGLKAKAGALNTDYPGLATSIGGAITPEWLGAKIIGRWQDGSPLVGNPTCPAGLTADELPDNDFAFGIDDPRGFACPLGSHIRRTNPRDSLEPGDPEEQGITNRHRLLRRGRSYAYRPEGEDRAEDKACKGLLFTALCSDIERQFEFVQHTWVNASSFHGLNQETDPLLGNPLAQGGVLFPASSALAPAELAAAGPAEAPAPARFMGGPNTRFTIPTAAGPVVVNSLPSYVTMRAGGYFFLPSRSALEYLVGIH